MSSIILLKDDTIEVLGTTLYRIQYLSSDTLGGYMCMNSTLNKTITDRNTVIINSKITGSHIDSSYINNSIIYESMVTDATVSYSKVVESIVTIDVLLTLVENENNIEFNYPLLS